MMNAEPPDECDECGTPLYQAGQHVTVGEYLRVDDGSFHPVFTSAEGILPPSYDGHVALYRAAASPCVCERCHFGRHSHDERATADVDEV